VTDTTAIRTFAGATPESDVLLSFCRDIFVNRLLAPLAGQTDLRVGGLQGSDSVSTRHPPLKPLPDPIPPQNPVSYQRRTVGDVPNSASVRATGSVMAGSVARRMKPLERVRDSSQRTPVTTPRRPKRVEPIA